MRVKVDPRVEPLLAVWMRALLPEFAWTLRGLRAKKAKTTWALGDWDLNDEVVRFEFGLTTDLKDADLEAIVVHEVAHGVRWLNPGCITRPNRGAPASFAWLIVKKGQPLKWELELL
jgi:predicted SprT family Zn-dependent metalloprotease